MCSKHHDIRDVSTETSTKLFNKAADKKCGQCAKA